MSFRFYRRIRVLPGVRLNISKSGVSTSIGTRGARLTFGERGIQTTIGLPGTGASYTSRTARHGSPVRFSPQGSIAEPEPGHVRAALLVILCAVVLLCFLVEHR
jgi:hypothetical protein